MKSELKEEHPASFNYLEFIRFLNNKKAMQSYKPIGVVIETDEENPQFVAWIPGIVDEVVTNKGFRVRVQSSTTAEWSAKALAELFEPNLLEEFSAFDQANSNSTP